MTLQLDYLPVIDNHAHPFLPGKEAPDPTTYLTTSLFAENAAHIPHLLIYRSMTRKLGEILKIDPAAHPSSIWEKRGQTYRKNPAKHIKHLFETVNLKQIFLDFGYPTKKISGYDITPKEMSELLPVDLKVIVRIEPIIMDLLDKGLACNDFIDAFTNELENQISNENTVALKTAVAYFAGLKIKNYNYGRVKESFDAFTKSPDRLDAAGPLFGRLVHLTLKIAGAHNLPVQIHTGFGNAPLLDLRCANPLHLFELLSDKDCCKTPVVLLHAGYPFAREAAFLANNYPNVYVDISQVTQFTGSYLSNVLGQLLSMAPVNKILYGSDGLGIPELFWWPALQAKMCLKRTLTDLIANGMITFTEAEEMAVRILNRNASDLYLSS